MSCLPRKSLFITLSLFLLTITACQNGAGKAGRHVIEGLHKQAKKAASLAHYEKAAEIYAKIIELDPSEKSLLEYAVALERAGNFEQASQVYQYVLSANPGSVEAMEGKASILFKQGRVSEAVEMFNMVLLEDATRWRTVNGLGVASALQGKHQQAIDFFEAALEITDNEALVLNNYGLALAFSGDYDEAADKLKESAEKFHEVYDVPKQVELNLSLVYGVMGEIEKAEELLKRHLNESQVLNNLHFYAKLNNNSKLAKKYFKKALGGSNNSSND